MTATTAAQLERLSHFIGRSQRHAIRYGLAGEESGHFADILAEFCSIVDAMPKPYDTENQGENAMVHLHYFKGGCDWWITERDSMKELPVGEDGMRQELDQPASQPADGHQPAHHGGPQADQRDQRKLHPQ